MGWAVGEGGDLSLHLMGLSNVRIGIDKGKKSRRILVNICSRLLTQGNIYVQNMYRQKSKEVQYIHKLSSNNFYKVVRK